LVINNLFLKGNNMKLIGATATILFNDSDTPLEGAYFSFGGDSYENETDSFGVPDSKIFYFAEDESEMKALMQQGVNDFKVLSYELEYAV
jgi:hypothetical protein